MDQSTWKDHLHLHFVVLLFGFTAILGKAIQLEATELVCYRMFLAFLGVGVFLLFTKEQVKLSAKSFIQLAAVGAIVAVHWITFFAAIKVSNVAVTLGCMASATLFTSLLEPFFEKRKLFWVEVVLGLFILIGLYIITQFAFNYYLGIIYALISAFLASLFGVFNRLLTKELKPSVISFYELGTGCLLIIVYELFTSGFEVSPLQFLTEEGRIWDLFFLCILAFACTSYAFVATVVLLKKLSAFTVSLAINMEPIYGIILAYLIFGESEKMELGFYVGTIILIASIFLYPILRQKFLKEEAN